MARTGRRRKPPVSLKDAELIALLTLAKQTRERDWVMILITYWHGLRASETINLRVRDFSHEQIFIVRGKGSGGGWQDLQAHENPLLDEKLAISTWLAHRCRYGSKGSMDPKGRRAAHLMRQNTNIVSSRADELLFPVRRQHFWRLVNRYALAAGIPKRKCKTHALKHTIAKHLIREGLTVDELMGYLGWRSLETPLWYLQPDEEELSNRVGQLIRRKSGFHWTQQADLFQSSRPM